MKVEGERYMYKDGMVIERKSGIWFAYPEDENEQVLLEKALSRAKDRQGIDTVLSMYDEREE